MTEPLDGHRAFGSNNVNQDTSLRFIPSKGNRIATQVQVKAIFIDLPHIGPIKSFH